MTISPHRFLIIAFAALLVVHCARAGDFIDDVEKELEYVNALVAAGVEKGSLPALEKAHRTLANLAQTAKRLEQPATLAAVELAVAFFYLRMAESVVLLQLSPATNPSGFRLNAVRETEHYFHRALATARTAGARETLADTYFFVGIGYDALRASLADFPGADSSGLFEKARAHVAKAVALGTSFPGAGAVLRRLGAITPASRQALLPPERFIALHTALILQSSLPRFEPTIEKTGVKPVVKNGDTLMDYKWRYSISRTDGSWEFQQDVTDAFAKVIVQRAPDKPRAGSGVQLTARPLSPAEKNLSLDDLVHKSLSVLAAAGYKIDSQQKVSFKGLDAFEIVLSHASTIVGEAPGAVIASKQFLLITVSSNILYVLSFNALDKDYDALFPDLKQIVNSFTPF
ncbi:MAG: hypothetical protein AB1742_09730 [bacterium]